MDHEEKACSYNPFDYAIWSSPTEQLPALSGAAWACLNYSSCLSLKTQIFHFPCLVPQNNCYPSPFSVMMRGKIQRICSTNPKLLPLQKEKKKEERRKGRKTFLPDFAEKMRDLLCPFKAVCTPSNYCIAGSDCVDLVAYIYIYIL